MVGQGLVHHRPLAKVWLGEAVLAGGRADEAQQIATEALRLARDGGERGHEAWALRLLGDIGESSGPRGEGTAADHYQEALDLANSLGMRPLVGRSLLGLGTLASLAAQDRRGIAHLEAAIAMFREMDMGWWLARAESTLKRYLDPAAPRSR